MAVSPAAFLIVERTPDARRRLREQMEQTGIRTIDEADGPREALAKLQVRSAVVFYPWEMEPLDGPAFVAEVRQLRGASACRIILLSDDGSWGRQTSARIAGADAVLVRPVRLEALRAKVDLVLARGAPRSYLRRA